MAKWEWTSPVRQFDGRTLAPIPNEIYLEVFNYLRPVDSESFMDKETRQIFSNLAMVCRFFSSFMLPWIFEDLTFSGTHGGNATSSSDNALNFCRNVLDGNPTALLLAKHVKRCTFVGWGMGRDWPTTTFLSLYCKAVQQMPNIQEVRLNNTIISKHILGLLPKIPQLSSLRLNNIYNTGSANQEKYESKLCSLRLKTLTVGGPCASDFLDRLLSNVNFASLLRFESVFRDFLHLMHVPKTTLSLESLELPELESVQQLERVLENAPSLKKLRIISLLPKIDDGVAEAKVTLKTAYVPSLAELEAPYCLCRAIIPGRPISRIEIPAMRISGQSRLGSDTLEVLKRSTRPITHLKVPLHFYLAFPFWEHFADLRTLDINVHNENLYEGARYLKNTQKLITGIVDAWPRHPDLHTFSLETKNDSTFVSSSCLTPEGREILATLSSNFPSLRYVNIGCHKSMLCDGQWELLRWKLDNLVGKPKYNA